MTKKFYKKFFLTLFLVLLIIFFNNYVFKNFLGNLVYRIAGKPGIFITTRLMKFSGYDRFLRTQKVIEENDKLKEENNALLGGAVEVEVLKRENAILRQELGVAARLSGRLLLIKIFNIERSPVSSTALINKGSLDGVHKSMPIIIGGNIFVGVIDQVFESSSSILLVDDPRAKISVRIKDSNILGNTRGQLQGKFGIDLLTSKDEAKEGDLLVTNGLDGLPEALIVGMIDKVESAGSGLFKKVKAKTMFDPSLGSDLFLILPR